MTVLAIMIERGGRVFARGTRWVCTHSTASTASGMPMCRNWSSVKKRSVIASGNTKLRTSTPRNGGRASNHSAVAVSTNCASRSHGSM